MISVITPTHNPKYIDEIYECLKAQTYQDWEWVIYLNGSAGYCNIDSRVRIYYGKGDGIGEIKHNAFMLGTGDYLVELDHDDLLSHDALQEIVSAFKETGADFVYSNFSEFFENGLFHYYPNWEKNGWRYKTATVNGKDVSECVAFAPSAASLSTIYYAPNHVRAWRRSFYQEIGGHNPGYPICDDHELLVRTYLKGTMHHVDKPLYLYRMGSQNTFSKNLETIRSLTYGLYVANLEALILREGELKGLPCYDLGGAIDGPKGWTSVDIQDAEIKCDLNERWPFKNNSVIAFRAHDIIEHIRDKQHVMRELHRCLVPGGWALIQVPSALGQGAYQDPTHVSYWVENSFRYYTDPAYARYIRNTEHYFMQSRLFSFDIGGIPYVKAELRKIGGDMAGIPGFRQF